jgi:hypothetical protein
MFNSNDQRNHQRSAFMSAVEGFATVAAGIAAFLLTPELHFRTVGFITHVATERYGAGEFVDLVSFVWFIAMGLLTFFAARATLATAIVAAGLAVATKLI